MEWLQQQQLPIAHSHSSCTSISIISDENINVSVYIHIPLIYGELRNRMSLSIIATGRPISIIFSVTGGPIFNRSSVYCSPLLLTEVLKDSNVCLKPLIYGELRNRMSRSIIATGRPISIIFSVTGGPIFKRSSVYCSPLLLQEALKDSNVWNRWFMGNYEIECRGR